MIYTKLTKEAMRIAYDAHRNQFDKAGVPYIYHPIHLAEQMNDEISVCVALLHDVLEDTHVSEESLRNTFPDEIINNVVALTKDENEGYFDYINRIKEFPVAKKVKLADLSHNMDTTRLLYINENTRTRIEKYAKAIKMLTENN